MRASIEAAKIHFKDYNNVVGVEVGVMRGHNALDMLKHWDNLFLHLVHSWKPTMHITNPPEIFWKTNLNVKYCLDAHAKVEDYKGRVKFHVADSVEAVKDFQKLNIRVDFVYIDGDHRYEAVKQDIIEWWKVIKVGGILCGHDYKSQEYGVIQAVDEFIKETGFKLNRGLPTDWYIFKEK